MVRAGAANKKTPVADLKLQEVIKEETLIPMDSQHLRVA